MTLPAYRCQLVPVGWVESARPTNCRRGVSRGLDTPYRSRSVEQRRIKSFVTTGRGLISSSAASTPAVRPKYCAADATRSNSWSFSGGNCVL